MTFGRKIFILACIVLPVLIITVFSYSRLEENFREKIYEERNAMVSLSAHVLYERLARLEDLGIAIATHLGFEDAVEKTEWHTAKKLLEKVPEDFNYVELLMVCDTIGAPKIEVTRTNDFSINDLAYEGWYKGVAQTWKPYLSSVYLSSNKPQHIVASLAVPIKNTSKRIIGILVMQVDVSKLLDWNTRFYDRGKTVGKEYIVDNAGSVALHPD